MNVLDVHPLEHFRREKTELHPNCESFKSKDRREAVFCRTKPRSFLSFGRCDLKEVVWCKPRTPLTVYEYGSGGIATRRLALNPKLSLQNAAHIMFSVAC